MKLENALIQKIKRGMIRRFKPAQPSTHSDHAQEPGPGQYIDPDIISKDN